MKTVKNLSKDKHSVGIFFHVDKKATVLATVDQGVFNRGDVAYDQHGLMICRAVYDPSAGDPRVCNTKPSTTRMNAASRFTAL